ncbi:hypothetical protein Hanom_Chr09g00804301 [Helianthus anomalus]
MMFPEHLLKEFYWPVEDKLDRPLSPMSRDWKEERLERGENNIHKALDNPVERVLKVDDDVTPDGFGGKYEQNKYTLLRKYGTKQKITDGDLADQVHPVDIITLKNIYDQDKGNRFSEELLTACQKLESSYLKE